MPLKVVESPRYTLHQHIVGNGEITRTRDMEVGQLGVLEKEDRGSYSDGYGGCLVLRTFDQLVALNSPRTTWSMTYSGGPDFRVRLLKPTDAITIVVK